MMRPALLSGISALVLCRKELEALQRHHRQTLCRLQKLNKYTPACVAYFLAGLLPIAATLHLRQLGLLWMVARLGERSILRKIGSNILLSNSNRKSWFAYIRELIQQYDLQDTLEIATSLPNKITWKTQCKARVLSWWEVKLREDVKQLRSELYFKQAFMSLNRTQPLWSTAENPFEVFKAKVVAEIISGWYVTESKTRHWNKKNPEGHCQICLSQNHQATPGTLDNLLRSCPTLSDCRSSSLSLWLDYTSD